MKAWIVKWDNVIIYSLLACIVFVVAVGTIFSPFASKSASDLEKALWGKWEKISGNSVEVIRFFPGRHIMVEEVKNNPTPVYGRYLVLPYSVEDKNPKRFLKIEADNGLTAILEMEFSENYSVLTLWQLPGGNRSDFKKIESY